MASNLYMFGVFLKESFFQKLGFMNFDNVYSIAYRENGYKNEFIVNM